MVEQQDLIKKVYSKLHPHGNSDITNRTNHVTHAAAVLVENDVGQILLLYHKKMKLYDLPAGKVEPNEIPSQAAKRELQEETGIKFNEDYFKIRQIGTFEHLVPTFPEKFIVYLFHVKLDDAGYAEIKEADKCLDMAFYSPSQMPMPRGFAARIALTMKGY